MSGQGMSVDARIGRLKRSAIDAWMHGQGWQLYDGHYEISSRGSDFRVTRPGADGEGGGDWSTDWLASVFGLVDRDDEFRESFATIRQTIDDLVAPWRDLPDPDAIAPMVEECRQVTRRLSGAANTGGDHVTGAGELGVLIRLVEQNLSSMAGTLIASYKAKFLGQLGTAAGGFHAISVVRGTDLAAQQALWTGARQHLDEVLAMAQAAMDAIAAGSGPEWRDIVTVVGWAAKGASIFATGGVRAALEVGGLAITVLSANATAPPTPPAVTSPGSYDSAIEALSTQLDQLSSRIRAEEQLIEDNLRENIANIERDRASFDLTQPAVYDLEDTVILEWSLLQEVYGTYMPAIAAELDGIALDVAGTATNAVLARDPSIGIGPRGTSATFFTLTQLLFDLVKELAWEARNGAENLKLAVADMTQVDARVAERLRQIAERVDQGSPYTPWD